MISEQYVGLVSTIVAALIVLLGTVAGLVLKRRTDRQAAIDAKAKAKTEADAKAQQENYDQIQEDLKAAREEARLLRGEMSDVATRYRVETASLWSQLAEMQAKVNEAEAHIIVLERHINEGAPPPAPSRRKATP